MERVLIEEYGVILDYSESEFSRLEINYNFLVEFNGNDIVPSINLFRNEVSYMKIYSKTGGIIKTQKNI